MMAPGPVIENDDLARCLQRHQLVASFAGISAASVHLAFVAGLAQATGGLVVASLLSATALRFLVDRDADPASLAVRSSRAVFVCSFVPLVATPAWIAVLDPATGIADAPWRSIALAAATCSGIAALVSFHWSRLLASAGERPRDDRSTKTGPTGDEARDDPSPRRIRLAIVLASIGLLSLLGDGVARALEQGWAPGRAAAAGVAFGASVLFLSSLLARWVGRELAISNERHRAGSLATADRLRRDVSSGIASLASRMAQIDELLQGIRHEGDRQAIERAHAAELARSLAPAARAALQRGSEMSTRIESWVEGVASLQAGWDALEARIDGLAARIETASRSSDVSQRDAQGGRVPEDRFSRLVRDARAGVAALGRAIRELDPATEAISGLARDVVEKAEIGRVRFGETVAGMEAIRAATQAAETVIRGLGARTHEIGGILDVIDEVGDQTSLLALNAAIIAAQAGEHGRAFSVVADEIRDLADRVLISTKEIGGLIRAVQVESEQAIGAIEAGSASVSRGVERSVEAGRTLDEITAVARDSETRITQVVTSVRRQAGTLDPIEALALRVEEVARDLPPARSDREPDPEVASRVSLAVAAFVQDVRATARDQAAGLARIEADLVAARTGRQGIASALVSHAQACEELARVIEGRAERGPSFEILTDRLGEAHRAIRVHADGLLAQWEGPAASSMGSSSVTRETGERS